MKFLIVNGDDFGLTRGVNRGVIRGFTHGILTSTSTMVNMPAFLHAVIEGKKHGGLAMGLHLNLTYGRPVSPASGVKSLTDSCGSFVKNPLHVLENGLGEEIFLELSAQTRKFLETGLCPSHIDTHHHLHVSEKILPHVGRIAKELKVPVRSLERDALLEKGIKQGAFFQPYFAGYGGVGKLLEILECLPGGITEIPCHPGYVDDELMELSSLNCLRENELQAITNEQVKNKVGELKIMLTNYKKLKGKL